MRKGNVQFDEAFNHLLKNALKVFKENRDQILKYCPQFITAIKTFHNVMNTGSASEKAENNFKKILKG